MPLPFFKSGEWNVICDSCGFLFHSSEIQERWDGMKVCKQDWEPRHPLDFVRGTPEETSVPFARPKEAEDLILSLSGVLATAVVGTYTSVQVADGSTGTIQLPLVTASTGISFQIGAVDVGALFLLPNGSDRINGTVNGFVVYPNRRYMATNNGVADWTIQ